MNQQQKEILKRSINTLLFLLLIVILIISYIGTNFPGKQFISIILSISLFYLVLILVIWYRERKLYLNYLGKKKNNYGNNQYIMCPDCKSIQMKGTKTCNKCNSNWITCALCSIPFDKGSSVLVSPCCGEGFHRDHFEAALRELSKCPICESNLAILEANW